MKEFDPWESKTNHVLFRWLVIKPFGDGSFIENLSIIFFPLIILFFAYLFLILGFLSIMTFFAWVWKLWKLTIYRKVRSPFSSVVKKRLETWWLCEWVSKYFHIEVFVGDPIIKYKFYYLKRKVEKEVEDLYHDRIIDGILGE
jgi:hypothetical protein